MNRPRWLQRTASVLLLCLLMSGLFILRIIQDGEQAMRASDAAFARGDPRNAALYARRAAAYYVPGAPYLERAYARLRAIATGAEAAGDRTLAESAWGDLRGAILESRHLAIPRRPELREANANLARLAASSISQRRPSARIEQDTLAALTSGETPGPRFALFASLGSIAASASLVLVGWRGLAPDGSLMVRHMSLAAGAMAIGAAFWTLAVLWG